MHKFSKQKISTNKIKDWLVALTWNSLSIVEIFVSVAKLVRISNCGIRQGYVQYLFARFTLNQQLPTFFFFFFHDTKPAIVRYPQPIKKSENTEIQQTL